MSYSARLRIVKIPAQVLATSHNKGVDIQKYVVKYTLSHDVDMTRHYTIAYDASYAEDMMCQQCSMYSLRSDMNEV